MQNHQLRRFSTEICNILLKHNSLYLFNKINIDFFFLFFYLYQHDCKSSTNNFARKNFSLNSYNQGVILHRHSLVYSKALWAKISLKELQDLAASKSNSIGANKQAVRGEISRHGNGEDVDPFFCSVFFVGRQFTALGENLISQCRSQPY